MSTIQAALTGALLGGLYAVMALGLSVSWGMLKVINLAHFGMILLGGYLTFQLAESWGIDPLLSLVVTVPLLFLLGAGLHWVYERTGLVEFTSLLVSFGVLIITIQVVHNQWTADFKRIPAQHNPYGTRSWFLGDTLALPLSTLVAFGFGLVLVGGGWVVLRYTFAGRALRAFAEDRPVAAAYGIDHRRLGMLLAGVSGATAAVAGMLWALGNTLIPDAPFEWIGIVFAVVILGGIGHVLGTLAAGVVVGVLASVASVVWENTASLLVVFLVIVLALLVRPQGLFVRRALR
jgi:branched-chain amino acid transport system permease protein